MIDQATARLSPEFKQIMLLCEYTGLVPELRHSCDVVPATIPAAFTNANQIKKKISVLSS